MIQQMLAIWSLVPLPFLNPVWTSGISWFTYCWSLAWRILSIICKRVRWVQLCGSLSILWHCPSLGLEWKLKFLVLIQAQPPSSGSVQFSSVTQLCPTLCNPMNRSTPGLPVHHQLPEFTQTHVHRVRMLSSHLILCRPLFLLPTIPPSISLFQWVNSSHEVAKVLDDAKIMHVLKPKDLF